MPVSGEGLEINTALNDNALLVNSASFTDGWMIQAKMSNVTETETLLDAKAYQSLIRQFNG